MTRAVRALRIVVTDDDPSLLTRVVEVLRGAGHVVFAAYDGLAACELTQVIARLDLLITNTRITNLDAPELIARVRAAKPELAILHLGRPLPQEGPTRGVPTLQEPFSGAELLEAVRRVLDRRPVGAE